MFIRHIKKSHIHTYLHNVYTNITIMNILWNQLLHVEDK